jgi:hypothetical protein
VSALCRTRICAAAAACLLGVPLVTTGVSSARSDSAFRVLGQLAAPGFPVGLTAARPRGGSQAIFISISYPGQSLDLVAFDSRTGRTRVFRAPLPGEASAWAVVTGPDGAIYLGTEPGAKLGRFDPATDRFTEIGQPTPGETYIWQLTVGPDGLIYGCTYPDAKLFRYDPGTGQMQDLGRMDPTLQYARSCVATRDGYIYVAVGGATDGIVAYDIATGTHQQLIPDADRGTGNAFTFRGDDGRVYGITRADRTYLLEGGTATQIAQAPQHAPDAVLADGRGVKFMDTYTGRKVFACAHGDVRCGALPVDFPTKPLAVKRLARMTDGSLVLSTIQPSYLGRSRAGGGFANVGLLSNGSVNVMLPYGAKLLYGAYGGFPDFEVGTYDPARPFAPGFAAGGNPRLLRIPGETSDWRPQSIVRGPGGVVYVGSVPGYGQLTGAITAWSVASGRLQRYAPVVANQSIMSLSPVPGMPDVLVGGTANAGAGGAIPTEPLAKLFLWDTRSRQTLSEVQVPRAYIVGDVIAVNAHVAYALSRANDLYQLVRLDLDTRQVSTFPWPCGIPVYDSIALRSGVIIALGEGAICTIDPGTAHVRVLARPPEQISAGFAIDAGHLYFASGDRVFSYTLPPSLRAKRSVHR